jgi:hypothetical protein
VTRVAARKTLRVNGKPGAKGRFMLSTFQPGRQPQRKQRRGIGDFAASDLASESRVGLVSNALITSFIIFT